jgi:hypothetical protein
MDEFRIVSWLMIWDRERYLAAAWRLMSLCTSVRNNKSIVALRAEQYV